MCLWDASSAIEVSLPLAPLLEGKKPTINFASLLEVFSSGDVACPAELATATLDPPIIKACKEALEMAERVMKSKAALAEGSDISAALGFSEFTLAMIIGQTLYIRDYLRKELAKYVDTGTIGAQFSPFCYRYSFIWR